MGNHSSVNLGLPHPDLKLKNGDRPEHVPCPLASSKSTFTTIFSDMEFKEYLFRNLHSTALITSIVQNSQDDIIVVDGIKYFRGNNREYRAELNVNIKKFQLFTMTGIKGNLEDTLDICEKDMDFHQDVSSSPFLRSFQCRLAAIRGMESSVLLERKITQERFLSREVSCSTLNSQEYPHVSALFPMVQAGLALVQVLPTYLPAAMAAGNHDVLVAPLARMCEDLVRCGDLHLFSSWSPPPSPPLKKIEIDASMVSANTGDAFRALNDMSHTYWSCPSRSGVWAARLPSLTSITALAVSWAPTNSPNSPVCGAPKKLVIMLRKNSYGSPYEHSLTVDLDDERKRCRSWHHVYYLEGATNVLEVMIQVTGTSHFNQSTDDTIKMFSLEVLTENRDATWIDMLSIMKEMQQALCALHDVPAVGEYVYPAILSAPRVTGSLTLLLGIVSHMNRSSHIETALTEPRAAEAFYRLLNAVRTTHLKLRDSLSHSLSSTSGETIVKDVGFDETAKSSEMVISDDGSTIGCNTGGNSYGLLTCEMDSGMWEWEITVTKDNHGDETSCLGVGRRPVSNCNYDTTNDMWLIRCYNGDLYHGGRMAKKHSIPHIHPNDICRFTYDSEAQTLSLAVNDVEVGVIFENVDRGVSPAVAFYGSGKTVKFLNIKKIGSPKSDIGIDPKELGPVQPIPTVEQIQESAIPLCSTLLGVTADLAHTQVLVLENELSAMQPTKSAEVKRPLEYPYCMQVSREVFEQIFHLLHVFMRKIDEAGAREATISLLRILNGEFACLTLSEVDPTEVGLGLSSGKNALLEEGRAMLAQLMHAAKSPDLRVAAAETFSQGIPIFLTSIDDKVRTATDLIGALFADDYSPDEAKFIVLRTVMKKISGCSEVVKLLQLYKERSTECSFVSVFLSRCLRLCVLLYTDPLINLSGGRNIEDDNTKLKKSLDQMLCKFQQQIAVDIASEKDTTSELTSNACSACNTEWSHSLFLAYCLELCYFTDIALQHYTEKLLGSTSSSNVSDSTFFEFEDGLKESIVCVHFVPLVHVLCFCLHHTDLIRSLCPHILRVFERVSMVVQNSSTCQTAQNLISRTLKRSYSKPTVIVDDASGWRQIKAHFEDSDSSFAISEDGTLYTSIHSSNTCAVATCGFSGSCRAAWEFLLESDSMDDECAVFGAAHMPITNRCYSASSDLYMRRAYNGYLYSRGRTTGISMCKIHPGDIVRVEFDGRAGTLSYSVNGSDLEVAFTDVVGEVYPCCGSYRNNTKIRLLKVEVYGSSGLLSDDEDDVRPADCVKWVVDSACVSTKDASVLAYSSDAKKSLESTSESVNELHWLTARGDRGASEGVHAWSFEVLEQTESAMAFGIVMGGSPSASDMLAGECYGNESISDRVKHPKVPNPQSDLHSSLSPFSLPPAASRRVMSPRISVATVDADDDRDDVDDTIIQASDILAAETTDSDDDFTNIPNPSDDGRSLESYPSQDLPPVRPTLSRTSTPAESPTLPQVQLLRSVNGARDGSEEVTDSQDVHCGTFSRGTSVESQPPSIQRERSSYSYADNDITALAWCTDGSLWINGEKKCDKYGTQFLPLGKYSTVTVRVNLHNKTVGYCVNGEYAGVAFGPLNTRPAAIFYIPDGKVSSPSSSSSSVLDFNSVYPAASISSPDQSLRLRAGGFHGSTVLPMALFVQKTLASVVGRTIASQLVGPPIDKCESELWQWTKSSLLVGGIDDSMSIADCSTILPEMSKTWCEAWGESKSYISPLLEQDSDSPNKPQQNAAFTALQNYNSTVAEFLQTFVCETSSTGLTGASVPLLFVEWLERILPDPPLLRQTLKKSGSYSFLSCELPVIACMLKHASLVEEARQVCEALRESTSCSGNSSNVDIKPSGDMVTLWMKIKQLRTQLRKKRQEFMASSLVINEDASAEIVEQMPSEDRGGGDNRHDESLIRNLRSNSDAVTPPPTDEFREYEISGDVATLLNQPYDAFEIGDNVEWITMSRGMVCRLLNQTNSSAPSTVICRIASMGIDYGKQYVYVRIVVQINNGSRDLMSPTSSKLIINGITIVNPAFNAIGTSSPSPESLEIAGCLRFNISESHSLALTPQCLSLSDFILEYGDKGFTPCILHTPESEIFKRNGGAESGVGSEVASETAEIDTTPKSFEQYCQVLIDKAKFLLALVPSAPDSRNPEGSFDLSTLIDAHTDGKYGSFSGIKLARWRSEDSHDRWKNVSDVLRVQKKIRREHSSDTLSSVSKDSDSTYGRDGLRRGGIIYEEVIPELDQEDDNDDISVAQKTLQECYMFIVAPGDSCNISLSSLKGVFVRRNKRAQCRTFALDMLNTVLNIPDVVADPFSIEETLLFLRSSLYPNYAPSVQAPIPDVPNLHYLTSLEGCTGRVLANVQSSFLDLYSSLSKLMDRYIQSWDLGPSKGVRNGHMGDSIGANDSHATLSAIFVMLSSWGLRFSSRDHRFLMKCSLLPSLHRLVSFEMYEKAVNNWLTAASSMLEFLSQYGCRIDECGSIQRSWKPWSSSYVQSGLRYGKLSSRALLYHISQAPSGILTTKDKEFLNMPSSMSLKELCLTYDVSSLSLLYERILQIFRRREERRQKALDIARASHTEAREKEDMREKQRLRDAGVPLFDPANQSSELFMEDADQVIGIRNIQSGYRVASSYVEITYNLSEPDIEKTGNYFEVTILNAGHKDIGIGLAVDGIFPVSGEMPGWDPHSYGYHGDDGRRFGIGSTSAMWPTWKDGDVIGCGIDFSRRSIFYTHNGNFLGDGFREVDNDKLRPVVSFHAPNILQRVRLNFGVTEFRYNGPEVHIHPAAASIRAERAKEARQDAFLDVQHTASSGDSVVEWTAEKVLKLSESELVMTLESFNEPATGSVSDMQIRLLAAYNMKLRRASHGDANEEKEETVLCETKDENSYRSIEWCRKEYIRRNKAVSRATMHMHEFTSLRNYAWALLRFILSSSCSDCNSNSVKVEPADIECDSDGRSKMDDEAPANDPIVKRNQSETSVFGTPRFCTIEDSLKLQEIIAASSMLEVLLGAQYLERAYEKIQVDGNTPFQLPVLAATPLGSPDFSFASLSASEFLRRGMKPNCVSSSVDAMMEVHEVEYFLGKHLFSFNSLLPYSKSLRDEICTPTNLHALLTISRVGSPRIQRMVLNLLSHCLPQISPELADRAYGISADKISPNVYCSKRKNRVMPDVVVRSLLARITHALAGPSEISWRKEFLSRGIAVPQCADMALDSGYNVPIGFGRLFLASADHAAAFIRSLFVAPLWTEVVACSITDAIRSGVEIVHKLNVSSEDNSLSKEEVHDLGVTAAACTVLCGIGTLRPGAKICSKRGDIGWVISWDDATDKAYVIWSHSGSGQSSCSYINGEYVSISSIQPVLEGVNLDLSTLSQPTLDELVKLLKELLHWFKKCNDDKWNGDFDRCILNSQMNRLTAVACTTISVLLEKQPDVIVDVLQDCDDVMKYIVEGSMIRVKLSHSPSLSEVCTMWRFAQSRIIESNCGCIARTPVVDDGCRQLQEQGKTAAELSPSGATPDAGDTSRTQEGPSDNNVLVYDSNSLESRIKVASDIAVTMELPIDICLARLEFFSNDKAAAISSLESDSECVPTPLFDAMDVPAQIAFSEDTVCRHSEYSLGEDGRPSVDTAGSVGNVPYACSVSRLSHSSSSDTKQQTHIRVSVGDIICHAEEEGALEDMNSRLDICMCDGEGEEVIVMYCDDELGVSFYQNVPRSESSVVSRLYEERIELFPSFSQSLDTAVIVLRLRQITSRMITDGSLNLVSDSNAKGKWLVLMKYIMRAENTVNGFKTLLRKLCESVVSRARVGDVLQPAVAAGIEPPMSIESVVGIMLEDISWNLGMLAQSSTLENITAECNGLVQKGVATSSSIFCSSPHHVRLNHTCSGEVRIPETWRGAMIVFDKRSATPGKNSTLSFYISKEDFDANSAYKTFWGHKGDDSNKFQSFVLPGTTYLSYRYQSSSLTSDPIHMIRTEYQNSSKLSDCSTGADKPEPHLEAYIAGCDGKKKGAWYFEVKVSGLNTMGCSDNVDSFVGIGESSKEPHVLDSSSSKMCFLTVTSNIVVNGKSIAAADSRHWSNGDVISCLFSAKDSVCLVWFAVNGSWSPAVEVEMAEEGYVPLFVSFNDTKFTPNFGESEFSFPPSETLISELGEMWHPLRESQSDAIITPGSDWGYQFLVRPLNSLSCIVTRDFEFVLKTSNEEGTGVISNGVAESSVLYFWRPKKVSGYRSCGDIVTRENRPPRGAILVSSEHCKQIKRYSKAFSNPKHDFTVWKPLPPEGFASLGDVVTPGTTKPNASACACIPLWALQPCGIGSWIFKSRSKSSSSGKGTSLCSIWEVKDRMGHFMGSPSDKREFSRKSSDGLSTTGIGFTFKRDLLHVLNGEWVNEAQDLSQTPSLTWTINLMEFMLGHPQCQKRVLTSSVFNILVAYMCSKRAPDGVAVVPIMIRMVRLAIQLNISIDISSIRNMCKSILNIAYSKCRGDKFGQLPDTMLLLVDFATEATTDPCILVNDVRALLPEDSTEFIRDLRRVSLSTDVDSVVSVISSPPWYERIAPAELVAKHRLLSKETTEHALATKTQILKQIRDVKEFLNSIDRMDSCTPESSASANCIPPQMIFSNWYKHLRACDIQQSFHPYCDAVAYSYRKVVSIPCASMIYVTLDCRSSLGPNSSLTFSDNSKHLVTYAGTDIGDRKCRPIAFVGSEVIIEFTVTPPKGVNSETSDADMYWGWSAVISSEGSIYETVSQSLYVKSSPPCVRESDCARGLDVTTDGNHDNLLILPTVPPSPSATAEEAVGKNLGNGAPLDSDQMADVVTRGRMEETGVLTVPFCQKLKVTVQRSKKSPDEKSDAVRKQSNHSHRVYVLQLRSALENDDQHGHLVHVTEGCTIEHTVSGSKAKYSLYSIQVKYQTPVEETGEGTEDMKEEFESKEPEAQESKRSTPPTPVPAEVSWSCPLCTFSNEFFRSRCDMCGTENPSREPSRTEDEDGNIIVSNTDAPSSPAEYAVWICARCTFMNPIDNPNCDICGFARGVEAPSTAPPNGPDVPELQRLATEESNLYTPDEGSGPDLEEENEPRSDIPSPAVPMQETDTIPAVSIREVSSELSRVISEDTAAAQAEAAPSSQKSHDPDSESDCIVLTAEGVFSASEKFETLLNQAILEKRWTPMHLWCAMQRWSRSADDCLLELFNTQTDSDKMNLHPLQWCPTRKFMTYHSHVLADYNLLEIQSRAMILCAFNSTLKHILPVINTSNPDPLSLGALIRKLNKYVFINVKQPMLQKSIDSSMSGGTGLPAHLNLDNFKATLSKDRGEVEPTESNNCFVQAFRQLHKCDARIYRYIFNSDRVFQIHFEGESGIDAGGVFREGITRIVEDLFDDQHFNLMVLCPNGQHSVHVNMDSYVPNPRHNTPMALQMMEFVGKLMAMSIRAKLALPFNFPSLVWKKILREEVTIEDLRSMDAITCTLLETVRYCDADGITSQELFQEKYGDKLRFTYTGCDGVERELFEGGSDVIVTYETKESYCDKVLEKRLSECDSQIEAMARGMEGVIQMRVLHLFSWQQVEVLVGGNPVFDIDVWKAHTDSSLPPKTLELFWKVIESLTPKEQEGFVRFAWGRSRLPPAKEFTVRMKLTSRGSEKLPVAHTCFFSIELPDYRTEEEMRHGILTAIHFGASGILMG